MLTAAGWACLCLSCSDERPLPAVPQSPSAATVATSAPKPRPEHEYFAGRVAQTPPGYGDFATLWRPEVDGWKSEASAAAIESLLASVLKRCIDAPTETARWADELAAPDFEGAGALVATELTTVRDDAWLSVKRARALPHDVSNHGGLAERLRAWIDALAGARDARVEVRVERLESLPSDRIETGMAVRVLARASDARLQQNLQLRGVWTTALPPRLVALELAGFEEIRSRAPVLVDVTPSVLGSAPFYADEIALGNDAYHQRHDRLSSEPFLGMHGVALGDVDGDGLEDVYLPQPAGVPNRLLLHAPDGSMRDAGASAGVDFLDSSSAALILDLDGDGARDLVVSTGPHLLVAWNDGHGVFRVGEALLGPDSAEIVSLSAADPDRDGDLDLYACRYTEGGMTNGAPHPYHDAQNGARNLFWRNDGARKFTEAAAEVGLDVDNTRFSQALLWDDLDDDGDVDLYVVNDFGQNDFYRNDGGKFRDATVSAGLADRAAGMGASSADVDLDGDVDLYVTNMDSPAGGRIVRDPRFMPTQRQLAPAYEYHARGNSLFLNRGDGTFEDATLAAGVARGGWAWGAVFFDLDNDGLEDLYVPNGFITGPRDDDLESLFWRCVIGRSPPDAETNARYVDAWAGIRHMALFEGFSWNGHERNYAYLNLGGAEFADISAVSGADYLDDARACAPVDWNDDGRMDLLLRNRTGPRLRLVLNNCPSSAHFLALRLEGRSSNRDAIGAVVRVESGGRRLRQSVVAAEGFLAAPSRRLVFGLGAATAADMVKVRWPDGQVQEFGPLAGDARYRIVEGSPTAERVEARPHAALEHPTAAVDERSLESAHRIVLFDRLPLQPIELAVFDGAPRTIASFAGRALVVCVAAPGTTDSDTVLEGLASKHGELDQQGVDLWCLARTDTSGIDGARASFASSGFAGHAGLASKRFLQALEVVLLEVLGPYERLPLPIVLVLDRAGSLVLLHCGRTDVARVVADAARVAALNPNARSTEKILGGRWARSPHRDFDGLATIFDRLGDAPLASYYRQIAAVRR